MSNQPKNSDASGLADATGATPPGAPPDDAFPADEFADIPSPPRRRPLMALGAVLLATYLIYHQRADIVYALSPATPAGLGDAATLFASDRPVPTNRYVRVEGQPDFESGLSLDTQGQWRFRQMFRLLGTDNRLFVQRVPDPLSVALVERTAFSGRLLRLDSLGFDRAIRAHYARQVSATHFFSFVDLHAAVAHGAAPLKVSDAAGQPVTLSGNEILTFTVSRPDVLRVMLPRDERFADAQAARAAIEKTGATVLSDARVVFDRVEGHEFEIEAAPEIRALVLGALADMGPGVRVRHAVVPWQVPARTLAAAGENLQTHEARVGQDGAAQPLTLTADLVQSIRTTATLELPADTLLLIEGERPADHYKSLAITAFLAAFAIINLIALIKGA